VRRRVSIITPVQLLSQPEAEDALDWLVQANVNGLTGFDASGWAATVWIVHAMYETDELPGGITHDEVHQIERAAGAHQAIQTGDATFDASLEELLADATVIGSDLGASRDPGPGWKRLLWSELAARLDTDPYALDVPPCFRSFPYESWPANIAPPGEGSLDREQFLGLLDHLTESSSDGRKTMCTAYRSAVMTGDFDHHTVFRCELGELPNLYDETETSHGAPNNIWPDDRSWFTYTDADLWATKVSGSHNLVRRLLADDQIEAVTLDF
jgi:hypothetical protein